MFASELMEILEKIIEENGDIEIQGYFPLSEDIYDISYVSECGDIHFN